MTTLKINLGKNPRYESYYDMYISGTRNLGVPKKNKAAYFLTNMPFLCGVMCILAYRLGYHFDPEHAPEFAFMFAGATGALYGLLTTLFEGKMTGHGVGLVRLNAFGFSRFTSKVILIVLGSELILYVISTELDFVRGEIYGFSFILTLILATLSWKYHYYYSTWRGREQDARTEIEDYSANKDDLDRYIDELRKRDLIE